MYVITCMSAQGWDAAKRIPSSEAKVFRQRNIFSSAKKTRHTILTRRHFIQIYIYEGDVKRLFLSLQRHSCVGICIYSLMLIMVLFSSRYSFFQDVHSVRKQRAFQEEILEGPLVPSTGV